VLRGGAGDVDVGLYVRNPLFGGDPRHRRCRGGLAPHHHQGLSRVLPLWCGVNREGLGGLETRPSAGELEAE